MIDRIEVPTPLDDRSYYSIISWEAVVCCEILKKYILRKMFPIFVWEIKQYFGRFAAKNIFHLNHTSHFIYEWNPLYLVKIKRKTLFIWNCFFLLETSIIIRKSVLWWEGSIFWNIQKKYKLIFRLIGYKTTNPHCI